MIAIPSEPLSRDDLEKAARTLAHHLVAGDVVALSGDLGAGKTTFARALIRELTSPDEDVPSPTFALRQTYAGGRLAIDHYDLYRLHGPREADGIGLGDGDAAGLTLIEWPERLGATIAGDRLVVALEHDGPETRRMHLTGHGAWHARLRRLEALAAFVHAAGWSDAHLSHLAGDASARRYHRLRRGRETRLVMDWPPAPDGPPLAGGEPYSRIAHLAENAAPFVALSAALRAHGLAAPRVDAADLDAGFLLLEDFGDLGFAQALARTAAPAVLYEAAIDVLLALPSPAGIGDRPPPLYDTRALRIEAELLPEWLLTGLPAAARAEFDAAWAEQFAWLETQARGLTLRDYHSPNILWRDAEDGLARIGVIDFQDAVLGHPAYDLVSLLQDARIDVAPEMQRHCLAHYLARYTGDADAFRRAYAVLGAQRATKILGIFARLAKRDGKRAYLAHLPRVAGYLADNLRHPALPDLARWYAVHLPRTPTL